MPSRGSPQILVFTRTRGSPSANAFPAAYGDRAARVGERERVAGDVADGHDEIDLNSVEQPDGRLEVPESAQLNESNVRVVDPAVRRPTGATVGVPETKGMVGVIESDTDVWRKMAHRERAIYGSVAPGARSGLVSAGREFLDRDRLSNRDAGDRDSGHQRYTRDSLPQSGSHGARVAETDSSLQRKSEPYVAIRQFRIAKSHEKRNRVDTGVPAWSSGGSNLT